MELKTQAVDRLLDALSPALAAELDHILNEARQALETDFQARLQSAVREAEASTRATAEAQHQDELRHAVDEARESVRRQVTDELQTQFAKTLEENTKKLQSAHDGSFQKAQAEWSAGRERLQQQLEEWRVFAEAQRQLMDASSQPEILMRWLKLAESFASSVAVYTVKADGLALWKSRGKAVFPEIISQQSADPESFFKPVTVRGKTVAAVCALQPFRPEALEFLVASMERAIELFGLKLRTPAYRE